MEIHMLYVPEFKTSIFKFPSVCLCGTSVDIITFDEVCGSKPNLVGVYNILNVLGGVKSNLLGNEKNWNSK